METSPTKNSADYPWVRPGCRGGELNSFTNYLYRGEQYDSDLGLYYLRARYYNPQTGRFLSRDPEEGVQLIQRHCISTSTQAVIR